jgi:hypothetical protein
MADDTLIAKALEQIAIHDAESLRLKRWVNDADIMLGASPRFGDLQAAVPGVVAKASAKKWGPGAFFNKPFSTAVRMILIARHEAAGNEPAPATVDEIHDALAEGSFGFETNGADAQKNSIRISLGKNSAAFVRLPNTDLFGLVEWYGKKPGKPGRTKFVVTDDDDDDGDGADNSSENADAAGPDNSGQAAA